MGEDIKKNDQASQPNKNPADKNRQNQGGQDREPASKE